MASSWSNDELDRAIAGLKQAYIDWATSGAAFMTEVDGVKVTYSREGQFLSAIRHLEELKRINAGTRKSRVEFR